MAPVRMRSGRALAAAIAFLLVPTLLAACGGAQAPVETTVPAPADDIQTATFGSSVTPSDRIFTFDDFHAAGVKHGKDYNIDGLPGATSAALGFHNTRDVEIRFFPSHDVAVAEGIPVAKEIVGPDVYIKRGEVT